MLNRKETQGLSNPKCVGTGLIALDIVTNGDQENLPHFWAGGSCGNVLTILAYLGWQSYPIARLGKDKASKTISKDMSEFGVDLRHVFYDEMVNTPIILQQILNTPEGNPTHRFFWVCPNCGTWLPRYRPVLLTKAKELDYNLPQMKCFYFDRVSPSVLYLAEKASAQGALIVFEPTTIKKDKQFNKAISLCDIIKYSHDGSDDLAKFSYNFPTRLVIETLGAKGLRYRLRKNGHCNKWKLLSAFRVERLRDTAGAGDWCTAGMIDKLIRENNLSFKNISDTKIVKALRYGQALSALNCGFEGARGVMYGLSKKQFVKKIHNILDRKEVETATIDSPSTKGKKTVKCYCPVCRSIKNKK